MKRYFFLFLIISGIYPGLCIQAQNIGPEVSEFVSKILLARNQSNELLHKHSWTSRIEVIKSNEILNIMIEKNQYDQQGQIKRTLLNEQGAKMPKAFLIREIAESEKENLEKLLYGLRDFLKKYNLPDMTQVKNFISAASWQVDAASKEFVFTGSNVEEDGDQLTWRVEDGNFSTTKIEVHTKFQGDEVVFTGTFIRMNNGLNYMAFAEANIPSKKIILQLQNFDYIQEF